VENRVKIRAEAALWVQVKCGTKLNIFKQKMGERFFVVGLVGAGKPEERAALCGFQHLLRLFHKVAVPRIYNVGGLGLCQSLNQPNYFPLHGFKKGVHDDRK
jgi:hypothetical protein